MAEDSQPKLQTYIGLSFDDEEDEMTPTAE